MKNAIRTRATILADGRVHPNVVAPNGKRKLAQTIPDRLLDWPEESFDGAYVLLLPSEQDQARLAKNAAIDQDSLHCTSAYLGNSDDMPEGVDGATLAESLRTVAKDIEPFKARLGGIIRFSAPNDYHLDPIVLNVDAPRVNEVRDLFLRRMKHEHDIEPDDTHGYTPHLTLGYIPYSEPLIANRLEPSDVTFDRIRLGFAGKEFDIRLGRRAAEDDRKKREPQIKAFLLNPFYKAALEHKVRHVRTLAGVRRFGLPIGSVIVPDPASVHTSIPWESEDEHERRSDDVDRALFGGMEVQNYALRGVQKDRIVRDLSESLEDDLDAELLSKMIRRNVGSGDSITDLGYVVPYVDNLYRDIAAWDRLDDLDKQKRIDKYRREDLKDYFEELMQMPYEDYKSGHWTTDMVARADQLADDGTIKDYSNTSESVRYQVINSFVSAWAATSSDINMQSLAKEQFDLGNAPVDHIRRGFVSEIPELDVRDDDDETGKAWREAYGYYLDAVYESTQKLLADKGITEVAVYRGMHAVPQEYNERYGASQSDIDNVAYQLRNQWETRDNEYERAYHERRQHLVFNDQNPRNDEELKRIEEQRRETFIEYREDFGEQLRDIGVEPAAIEAIDNSLFSMDGVVGNELPLWQYSIPWSEVDKEFKPIFEVDVATQPLSSWTTDQMTAMRFGKFYYQIVVPAERVWSTALTGAGCLNEKELILVGGVDHARVRKVRA